MTGASAPTITGVTSITCGVGGNLGSGRVRSLGHLAAEPPGSFGEPDDRHHSSMVRLIVTALISDTGLHMYPFTDLHQSFGVSVLINSCKLHDGERYSEREKSGTMVFRGEHRWQPVSIGGN